MYVRGVSESKQPDDVPADLSTDPSTDLSDLRARIDAVDTKLVELLAERMQIVARVAEHKRVSGRRIRDPQREEALLAERGKQAEQLGLQSGQVEAIYRLIMLASRDYQASMGAESPTPIEPRKVAIIGGRGEMGSLMCRMLGELGHEVSVADHETTLRPEQAAAAADVVIVSVPIDVTEEVIRQVGPQVRDDAILMDVTSIKTGPMAAMLAATGASVVGAHPMFGPGVHSLIGQRVVLCPGRGDAALRWARDNLTARGLVVTEATAAEHDRGMALVQVLTHYQTQVLGLSLARSGVALSESLRFTSPAYLMELYVAARHFAQAPELYGPIEMRNGGTRGVTDTFRAAADEIAGVLQSGDQARFEALFEEVRAYFGEFTREAIAESSFLIDRLVERSLG